MVFWDAVIAAWYSIACMGMRCSSDFATSHSHSPCVAQHCSDRFDPSQGATDMLPCIMRCCMASNRSNASAHLPTLLQTSTAVFSAQQCLASIWCQARASCNAETHACAVQPACRCALVCCTETAGGNNLSHNRCKYNTAVQPYWSGPLLALCGPHIAWCLCLCISRTLKCGHCRNMVVMGLLLAVQSVYQVSAGL